MKQREGARPPGMADVARVAGVSAQTVSRALAGHPNVQDATRAKVLAAVEQLGYRKNTAAGTLSSGRSRTIGVVTLQTGFFARTALTVGVERAARDAGYAVSTATTASSTRPRSRTPCCGSPTSRWRGSCWPCR